MVNIPQGAPQVYVSFSSEITPQSTEALIGVMTGLANKGVQDVHLLLSTPGGNVMNGFNLYNVLRGLPFNLTTHNVGSVSSIGNVMFLAGTTRNAVATATFMYHGVGFNTTQNQRLEEKFLRDHLDSILSDQKRIGAIIAQHTTLNARRIAGMFRQAQTKDAQWALNEGVIHNISDVQVPNGVPVIPLIFQRQGV